MCPVREETSKAEFYNHTYYKFINLYYILSTIRDRYLGFRVWGLGLRVWGLNPKPFYDIQRGGEITLSFTLNPKPLYDIRSTTRDHYLGFRVPKP